MEFEAATVKLSTSASGQPYANFQIGPGDFYTPSGGVFSTRNLPLIAYIYFAYKISGNDRVSLAPQLPVWTSTTRYDIQAQSPDRMATKDQMRLMVQSFLADRFNLKIHTETRTVPVFALVLSTPGKTGPQLQPHPDGDTTCSTKPTGKEVGMFPATCSGVAAMTPRKRGNIRYAARNIDFNRIAIAIPIMDATPDRQVLDQTGLTGHYDFNLEWTPAPPNSAPPAPAIPTPATPDSPTKDVVISTGASRSDAQWRDPRINSDRTPTPPNPNFDIFSRALDQQLGLKLIPQQAPMPTLVLDHIDQLSEN
jgi:uncharacterized protein (TIGR03435 family)